MSKIDEILTRLEHVRASGKSRWTARCPAHEDRDPSLSVAVAEDGRILLHCHAGCGASEVVGKLGLRLADLFADPLYHFKRSERPVTVRNVIEEAKALDRVVGAFKETGRILDRQLLEEWAKHFVSILRADRRNGIQISQEDVTTLRKIRASVLRSVVVGS